MIIINTVMTKLSLFRCDTHVIILFRLLLLWQLQVWDTAGSEKYRTLTSNYYHSAAACLCIYDLLAEDSLYSLDTWISDVQRFQPDSRLFLVGNKCDAESDDIAVEPSTAEAFQQKHSFKVRLIPGCPMRELLTNPLSCPHTVHCLFFVVEKFQQDALNTGIIWYSIITTPLAIVQGYC